MQQALLPSLSRLTLTAPATLRLSDNDISTPSQEPNRSRSSPPPAQKALKAPREPLPPPPAQKALKAPRNHAQKAVKAPREPLPPSQAEYDFRVKEPYDDVETTIYTESDWETLKDIIGKEKDNDAKITQLRQQRDAHLLEMQTTKEDMVYEDLFPNGISDATGVIPDSAYTNAEIDLLAQGLMISTMTTGTFTYTTVRQSLPPQKLIKDINEDNLKKMEAQLGEAQCGSNNCAATYDLDTFPHGKELAQKFGYNGQKVLLRFPKASTLAQKRGKTDFLEFELTVQLSRLGIAPKIVMAFPKRFIVPEYVSAEGHVDIWIYMYEAGFQDLISRTDDLVFRRDSFKEVDGFSLLGAFNVLADNKFLLLDMKPENMVCKLQDEVHEFKFIDFDNKYVYEVKEASTQCVFVINAILMLNYLFDSGRNKELFNSRFKELMKPLYYSVFLLTMPKPDGGPPDVTMGNVCDSIFRMAVDSGKYLRNGKYTDPSTLNRIIGMLFDRVWHYGQFNSPVPLNEKAPVDQVRRVRRRQAIDKEQLVFPNPSESFMMQLIDFMKSNFDTA